jgi:bacillithiol biosynthesis deacetylase BshB1
MSSDSPEVAALVIAPHPDDAELGMGGTVARLIETGISVAVVDLTDGEPTPFGSSEIRAKESKAAGEALGLAHREMLGLPNRNLVANLENRYVLAGAIRRYRPRWLFAPFAPDAHPDHRAATELIEDARFAAKLTKTDLPGQPHYPERVIYYYCSHLKLNAQPSFLLDVSTAYEKKLDALRAYESQFFVGRGTDAGQVVDVIEARDRYFGTRINRLFAEPFFVHEPVGLERLDVLI